VKIIVLHGPGEVGKRTEALRIRKQFPTDMTVLVDLKQDSLEKLEWALTSVPMFGSGPRLVVSDNTPDKLDLSVLPLGADDLTFLLLSGPLKSASSLLQSAQKQKAKIFVFEGEKELSVFPFLDCLLDRKKEAFSQLEKLTSEYEWVYILTMVYYGLRRNILPLPASSYARGKIEVQKRKFKLEDFENLYKFTLDTEFSIKMGKIPPDIGLARLVQKFNGGEYSGYNG